MMGVFDRRSQFPNGTLNGVVVAAATITRTSKDRTRMRVRIIRLVIEVDAFFPELPVSSQMRRRHQNKFASEIGNQA
jgi:hypothetical protein